MSIAVQQDCPRTLKRRVTHIIASVAEEASGPSYTVPRLCEAIQRYEWSVRLTSVSKDQPARSFPFRHDSFAPDWQSIPVLRRLQFSSDLRKSLTSLNDRPSIFHGHGLWLMPNLYPYWVARSIGVPIIISPRGMLGAGALRFSPVRKKVMWLMAQKSALERASCFHATSWQEFEDIRRAGLSQPVAVIPNGIDIPQALDLERSLRRKALYLGRLHPKKGLRLLLQAWARVEAAAPCWDLEIVGPSEIGYRQELESLSRSLGLKNVMFRDAVYGDEKFRLYESARLFVMPTLDENFGMTVAEALASGVPVLCSKGAPWEGLEAHGCGWWVDGNVDAFTLALRGVLNMNDARLQEMGARGRAWMHGAFSWAEVGGSMAQVYDWMLGVGDLPSCVYERS